MTNERDETMGRAQTTRTHNETSSTPPLRLAVFGDVHGRLPLMLAIARLMELHTGESLDAIVQAGDLGAYPDHGRLDRATQRHAANDPDELDFAGFVTGSEEAERWMGDPTCPPVFFVRGNHEDFDFLGQFTAPTTLDPWGRLWFLPDNSAMEMDVGDRGTLRVAGFGGIPPTVELPRRGAQSRTDYRSAQRKAATDGRRFTTDDAREALIGVDPVDVLLTHAGPAGYWMPEGSVLLAELMQRVAPRAHFFGHHHRVVGPLDVNGAGCTLLAGLEHLEFSRRGPLKPGSCGLLEIGDDETTFEFADHIDGLADELRTLRQGAWREQLQERV